MVYTLSSCKYNLTTLDLNQDPYSPWKYVTYSETTTAITQLLVSNGIVTDGTALESKLVKNAFQAHCFHKSIPWAIMSYRLS